MGQKTVSGTIIDENNEALIGASVFVKGTDRGTITDIDGNFSIEANDNDVLVISYVGMRYQEITVSGNTDLSITMYEDATTLSDIVVTATRQPVRKIKTTTAINTIGST